MASIADILIAKGNAAAAGTLQRGNIYADLIRNLSSIPGQAMQQQRALEQDRLKQQIQQQQLQVGQQELDTGRAAAEARKRNTDIMGIIGATPRLPNGDVDEDAVAKAAAAHDPTLEPYSRTMAQMLNTSTADYRRKSAEAQNVVDDANGEFGLQLLHKPDMGNLQVILGQQVKNKWMTPEEATQKLTQAHDGGEQAIREIAQQMILRSKPARDATAAKVVMQKPDEVPLIQQPTPGGGVTLTPAPGIPVIPKYEPPTAASLAATANDLKQPPPVRAAAQAALNALQATPGQEETVRHNKAMEDIGRLTSGREAAAQQETARHNKAMEDAAAKSKSARPVLSSDANRITDIDTGIKEADALNAAIAGRTGTGSWVGANLPDFVTNLTGLGTESKQRQAIIDRIRQMIGKTLEGGVLRKEDEIKYAKILPTIGDPPDVVATKIAGLRETLQRKRETTLESLDDAGFNVEAFKARGAPQAPTPPTSGAAPPTTPRPATPATAAQFKVGDIVSVKGQKLRITAIHPDGTFDGDLVR